MVQVRALRTIRGPLSARELTGALCPGSAVRTNFGDHLIFIHSCRNSE